MDPTGHSGHFRNIVSIRRSLDQSCTTLRTYGGAHTADRRVRLSPNSELV